MRRSVLGAFGLTLLVVSLLVAGAALSATAQNYRRRMMGSNSPYGMMRNGTDHENCPQYVDADGDGVCDHYEAGQGHMDGMHGAGGMGMRWNSSMQFSGSHRCTNATR